MKDVGIYCRESIDRSGRAENVADQERWGREYAASKWPGVPVRVFTDNDVSAVGKPRPGYEALRAAIGRGEIAHVWAKEQSRFERDEIGWFIVAAELDAAGLTELHTDRDGVVQVRSDVAGIKAVIAAGERRRLMERINDRLDSIAGQGLPPGSRPFGYVHAFTSHGVRTYAVVPEQAQAIRDAAARVLSGWSLAAVAAELRERGLKGGHGGTITAGTVRRMLTSPTVAGRRIHRGRDVGAGNWPAILDADTQQAVADRLAAARTVRRSDGGTYPVGSAHSGYTGRRYALTGGLAVCGRCGAPLKGQVLQAAKGKPYLQCYVKGCGLGIMLPETEAYVADRLFAELDKPEFLDRIAADGHSGRRDELTRGLRAVEAKRRELARMWGADELTTEEWQGARQAQDEREQRLRSELAAVAPPPRRVDAAQARAAWPAMTLGEKREMLRLFIDRVVVKPATRGRRGFDDGRVDVEFIER